MLDSFGKKTLQSHLSSYLRAVLGTQWSKCFMKPPRTLNDLLRVISEELAERRPLGPLQGVEQLLDLSGHSAVHRNSYKVDENGEGQWTHSHTHSGSNIQ